MRDVWALIWLELRGMYGLNRFLHQKDRKARRMYLLLAGVFVLLAVMVGGYAAGLAYGLCLLGMADIVPMYLVFMASLLVFAFGLFRAGPTLFSRRGYDLVTAMPVRAGAVVVSRFVTMYAEDLLLTLVILLPGAVTYGVCCLPGPLFYPTALMGALLIPALPLVASGLLGTAVMAVSSGMRHKSLVQTALMVMLVVGILLGSAAMSTVPEEALTAEMFGSLAQTVGELLGGMYPPARWLGDAMTGRHPAGFLLFAGFSALLLAVALTLVGRFFHPIMRRLMAVSARHDFRLGALKSRGLRKALFLREVKRYFASSVYVTNTIIGPIMGCLMCVALCVAGVETITGALPVPIDVAGLAPFAVAAVFCMMTTTSTSVSMEGKQFWILRSLPVPVKALLDAKILLNLALMAPFFLVAEVCLTIALRPGPLALLWQLLIPAALMLFSVVAGVTGNLRFHSFDWEKEEQVVKQSASAMLGGFLGMLTAVLLLGLTFVIPTAFGQAYRAAVCMGLLVATWALYRRNNRVELSGM